MCILGRKLFDFFYLLQNFIRLIHTILTIDYYIINYIKLFQIRTKLFIDKEIFEMSRFMKVWSNYKYYKYLEKYDSEFLRAY